MSFIAQAQKKRKRNLGARIGLFQSFSQIFKVARPITACPNAAAAVQKIVAIKVNKSSLDRALESLLTINLILNFRQNKRGYPFVMRMCQVTDEC